jgi:hypothetical protein
MTVIRLSFASFAGTSVLSDAKFLWPVVGPFRSVCNLTIVCSLGNCSLVIIVTIINRFSIGSVVVLLQLRTCRCYGRYIRAMH